MNVLKKQNIAELCKGSTADSDSVCLGSNPSSAAKKRTKQSLRSFFIQSEGLVWNLTAGEYGIAVGVWHHAPACIFLRIDAIHHFVMIPYGTSCQFHAATSCGFHPRPWRDLARSACNLPDFMLY